jgi:hypothetical protein
MENFFFMDFYDEEYEKAYKPRYEVVDEKATALVDLALVVLAIALLIEILRLSCFLVSSVTCPFTRS